MKLLLLFLLTLTTFFSQAQQTNPLHKDGTESTINMTCMLIILLITLFIAGAVYFLVNNKRGGINSNSNSGKNTPAV